MTSSLLAKLLGDYIRRERKAKGITQRALKEKLGFSAQFLGHIESGKAMVPDTAFKILVKELGLDINEVQKIYNEASRNYLQEVFTLESKVSSQNNSTQH